MAEDALSSLVEHALNIVCDGAKRGETEDGAAQVMVRLAAFRALHTLPLCSRQLLHAATAHPAFELALFYDRVRLGVVDEHYFLDGVPAGVQLFVGYTSLTLPHDAVGRLRLSDAMADRMSTVSKIERLPPADPRRAALPDTHNAALGPLVPAEMAALVARTRAVFQTLRAVKSADQFKNCENCQCQRLMFVGSDADSWSGATSRSIGDVEEEPHESSDYWDAVAGEQLERAVPDTRRFCSRACARQHAEHLALMMPDRGIVLDADDASTKRGRARVADAFRLALKRNETAARALRTIRGRSPRGLAVSQSEIGKHCKRRITALNVDLGVLYAASILAESKTLSEGKVLPGMHMYWRDDSMTYARAVAAVKRAYSAARRDSGVVSSLLTLPKYLEAVGARATKLFTSRQMR